MENGTFVGATHSAELFYVFHTLSIMGGSTVDGEPMKPRLGPAQYALSGQMGSYWTNFVKRGCPNAPGLPYWPAVEPGNQEYLHLKAEGPQAEGGRCPEREEFLRFHLFS